MNSNQCSYLHPTLLTPPNPPSIPPLFPHHPLPIPPLFPHHPPWPIPPKVRPLPADPMASRRAPNLEAQVQKLKTDLSALGTELAAIKSKNNNKDEPEDKSASEKEDDHLEVTPEVSTGGILGLRDITEENILTISEDSPKVDIKTVENTQTITHPTPHDNVTITKLTQRISSLEESNIALHNYINELNIRLLKPEDGGYERGGAAFDKLNNFTQKTEEYGRLLGDLSESAQDLEKQISTLTTSVSDTSHADLSQVKTRFTGIEDHAKSKDNSDKQFQASITTEITGIRTSQQKITENITKLQTRVEELEKVKPVRDKENSTNITTINNLQTKVQGIEKEKISKFEAILRKHSEKIGIIMCLLWQVADPTHEMDHDLGHIHTL